MVSIIIPIFNVAAYLPKCLDTVIGQTYKDIEIILVDDGSTDESGHIADTYAQQDSRIRVIHQANQGLSAARNVGLQAATGDYVWFIDSDDYVSTEACERLIEEQSKANADIVIFARYRFNDQGKQWEDAEKNATFSSGKDYIYENLTGHFVHAAWNKLIKRSLLIDNHIEFAQGRYEDCYFSFKSYYFAQKVITISDTLYFYRVNRPTSIVNTINPKDTDVLLTIERLEQFLAEQHDNLAQSIAFQQYVFLWIFSSIMIKYPCKMICNRHANDIVQSIIQDKRFNKYVRAVAASSAVSYPLRIAAWSMEHCYNLFAFVLYISYHIKHIND